MFSRAAIPRISGPISNFTRRMMSSSPEKVYFGPFEVTEQVFHRTPHSFALVNLKPLLPGHVLVCPLKPHKRLTDLSPTEVTDLFATTQIIQHMLARHYFNPQEAPATRPTATETTSRSAVAPPEAGSFNIAIQDGAGAGQTVSHVHVHVIPRIPGATSKDPGPTDEIYDHMAEEDGNIGGALWDAAREKAAVDVNGRPEPGGAFPRIEDCHRKARSMEEMVVEADIFKEVLRAMQRQEEAAQ